MNKIFLLTLSLVVSLYAFMDEDSDITPVQVKHVKVTVIAPKAADMNIPIDVQGVTEEVGNHTLNAPYDGILHTKVTNTQKVTKGEVIATIENRELDNKLHLANSNLALYSNQLTIETKKLQSSDEMLKMGLISTNDYLTQKSLQNEKEIALSGIKNERKNLNILMAKSVIKSPVTGYVSNLQADGSYLSYASTICKIDNARVHVRLYVPALYAKTLRIGQNVTLHVEASDVEAHISQILPSTTNNLVNVIATSATPLEVGLNIEASIQTQNKSGWIIPKECIILVQNRPAVFIINNNTAHVHFVDVQKDMIDKVLIVDDLKKSDQIAYKNSYMLEENSVVEVSK